MGETKTELKIIGISLLSLLYLGLGIYAAVTAGENKPSDNDGGLYIASYIICIIQSIIYIFGSIYVPCMMMGDSSSENGKEGLPFLITIYFIRLFFIIFC